jgi:hypothetical protein
MMTESYFTFHFRFLLALIAGAVLTGLVAFPDASWGGAEDQNLRSSTLRQYDFLIARVSKGEPFDPPARIVVDKIAENLDILSTYLTGSIKKQEFQEVAYRLYTAVDDWESGQLMDAKVGLLKSKSLLGQFGF